MNISFVYISISAHVIGTFSNNYQLMFVVNFEMIFYMEVQKFTINLLFWWLQHKLPVYQQARC